MKDTKDLSVEDNPAELSEIIANGGYTEVKAQESRQLDGKNVQVIECRVFFIDPNA